MADVTGRLSVLEEHVRRALDRLGSLREENARLARERDELRAQVDALATELAMVREREEGRGRLEHEHRRLLDERRQLLGQVDGILKELTRIEGL